MKGVLSHMKICTAGKQCKITHCSSSRQILTHWHGCEDSSCGVCSPFKIEERREPSGIDLKEIVQQTVIEELNMDHSLEERVPEVSQNIDEPGPSGFQQAMNSRKRFTNEKDGDLEIEKGINKQSKKPKPKVPKKVSRKKKRSMSKVTISMHLSMDSIEHPPPPPPVSICESEISSEISENYEEKYNSLPKLIKDFEEIVIDERGPPPQEQLPWWEIAKGQFIRKKRKRCLIL